VGWTDGFDMVLPSPPICGCFVMTMDWSAIDVPWQMYNSLARRLDEGTQAPLTYPPGRGEIVDLEQVV
jgi:hypothetical protein